MFERRGGTLTLRLVAGLAALLIVCSCESPARLPTPAEPQFSVLIAGDSLTTESPDAQRKYVGYAYTEARFGRAMVQAGLTGPGALEMIAPMVDRLHPQVIVMEIGTNDILSERPMDLVIADAEALIASVPADSTIIWVALASDRVPDRAAAFNTWLRSRIPVVVPWDEWVAANPGHLPDGIHNDAFAADAYWKLIGQTLKLLRPL